MSNVNINFRAVVVSESMPVPLANRAANMTEVRAPDELFVELGMVNQHQLHNIGSTATPVVFAIRFENPGTKKVAICFQGGAASSHSEILTTTNPAVGIQLRDSLGNIIPINATREYDSYPGQNELTFTASLFTTAEGVLPGNLAALAAFTLTHH